jgi:hypothetical protein
MIAYAGRSRRVAVLPCSINGARRAIGAAPRAAVAGGASGGSTERQEPVDQVPHGTLFDLRGELAVVAEQGDAGGEH